MEVSFSVYNDYICFFYKFFSDNARRVECFTLPDGSTPARSFAEYRIMSFYAFYSAFHPAHTRGASK
jgi:hypothetical protein